MRTARTISYSVTLILLIFSINVGAQKNVTIEFQSASLSESRTVHIHIPKSYFTSNYSYPVIYSMDGDYTRFPLNGTMEYYSFWKKAPECITVSIEQNYLDTVANKYKRWMDCDYSWKSGLPEKTGINFKDFIIKELVPFIDSTYRTTSFRAILGHSFTANYVNYFLLDSLPTFNAYVAMSPYYASNGLDSIKTIVENLKKPILYFVAAGEKDLSGHIKSVIAFDKEFSKIGNENFYYKKFDKKGNNASHSTIVPIAMMDALEHIFSLYRPIDDLEFKNLLKITDKVKYLEDRYSLIKDIYGIEMSYREDDLNTVAYATSKKKQWEQLKKIAELTISTYPESYSGYFSLGEYEEKMGYYEKALIQYEIGISKLGSDVSNIVDFQKDADRVKAKIK